VRPRPTQSDLSQSARPSQGRRGAVCHAHQDLLRFVVAATPADTLWGQTAATLQAALAERSDAEIGLARRQIAIGEASLHLPLSACTEFDRSPITRFGNRQDRHDSARTKRSSSHTRRLAVGRERRHPGRGKRPTMGQLASGVGSVMEPPHILKCVQFGASRYEIGSLRIGDQCLLTAGGWDSERRG
jgi:hypothetical protein